MTRIASRLTTRERAAVLALATGVAATRARGASSNARLGASFEDALAAVLATMGHVARGNPGSKVVTTREGRKTIYTAKNGVDFVGVVCGVPAAIEAKRLPGAASLAASKDSSTRAEAAWLLAHRDAPMGGGGGGFLVHDPGWTRVYVVRAREQLETLAAGGLVRLRERDGTALVPCVPDTDLAAAVRMVVGVAP